MLTSVLDVAGAACFVTAAFLVSSALGLATAGGVLLFLSWKLTR